MSIYICHDQMHVKTYKILTMSSRRTEMISCRFNSTCVIYISYQSFQSKKLFKPLQGLHSLGSYLKSK